jgi:protein ImuA
MAETFLHQSLAKRASHEFSGSMADAAALWVAGSWLGRVAVVGLDHDLSCLDPHGLPIGLRVDRLLFTAGRNRQDVLWSLETTLRSGAISTAIGYVGRGLDLTESRRVQLAAEAGGASALIVSSAPRSSTAAETRWSVRPVPVKRFDSPKLRLECYRNKRGTTGAYIGTLDRKTGHIHLVSAAAAGPCEA